VLTWLSQHRVLGAVLSFGLVAAIVLGVIVVVVLIRSGGTPVNLREALRLYRHDQAGSAQRPAPGQGKLPPDGVYEYRTGGGEQLNLPGLSRAFPPRTAMLVTSSTCGREVRWEALQQHMEELTECAVGAKGLGVSSMTTDESIAGVSNVTTLSCEPGAFLLPPHAVSGQRWTAWCNLGGARVGVRGKVMGFTDVDVAGRAVPAVHTRVTLSFSGTQSGTNPTDYWLALGNSLILREIEYVDINQTASVVGSVHYTERADLSLVSTSPVH